MNEPYQNLLSLGKELQLVSDSASLLSWDQEVLMPSSGIGYRGEQMAWFSGYLHDRFTAPEVGEWIGEAEAASATDPYVSANLREWRHQFDRSTCLPKRLVQEFAEARVLAQSAWAESRKRADFSLFAPHLSKLVTLSREHAEGWGYEGCLYDALLDQFERGATTEQLTATLGSLRESLLPIVEEATAREPKDRTKLLSLIHI